MTDLNSSLAALQRCEYDLVWFRQFMQTHQESVVVVEQWTIKLRLVAFFAQLFPADLGWRRVEYGYRILQPIDWLAHTLVIAAGWLWLRLLQLHGLTIVTVAGSYGKTSTKHIAKHLLMGEKKVWMTPKSVNVPLGIAIATLRELRPFHQVALIELGEFRPGDIGRMLDLVRPAYAVLTPIGRQHLERFGSVEEIEKNFLALRDRFKRAATRLLVWEGNRWSDFPAYGTSEAATVRLLRASVDRSGTHFSALIDGKSVDCFMPLYGEHQAENSLAGVWLAGQLGVALESVVKQMRTIPYIKHRHEPYFMENEVLVLDNGYNSNPDSVGASIQLAKQLSIGNVVVITPGFVELGAAGEEIHQAFGKQLAGSVTAVGLVSSPAAPSIAAGWRAAGGDPSAIIEGDSQEALVQKLQPFITPGSVILFENGVNEIYR